MQRDHPGDLAAEQAESLHLGVEPNSRHLREVGPYCVLLTAENSSPALVPTEHALGHWLLRLGSTIP